MPQTSPSLTTPGGIASYVHRGYVDSLFATIGTGDYLPLTGGTLIGPVFFDGGATFNVLADSIDPDPTDDSTHIPTTQWVRQRIDEFAPDLSGYLLLSGGAMIGPLIIPTNDSLIIDGMVNTNRSIVGQINGVNHWKIALGVNAATEPFSSFAIQRFNSTTGALIDTPLTIFKDNGGTVFSSSINCGLLVSTSDLIAGRNVNTVSVIASSTVQAVGFSINSASDVNGAIYRTITATNGLRWQIRLGDGTPETGGNAGNNFAIESYDDTSTGTAQILIDTPLSINRATGAVTIPNLVGYVPVTEMDILLARVATLEAKMAI
jgi:hypothetical protein